MTAQSSGVRGLSLRNDVTWGTYLSPVYQADFPFNAVGLAWTAETPPGSRIELEVRASPDGQDWSEWFEVEPLDGFSSETGEHRSQLIVAGGNFLQYRATLYAEAEELVPVLSGVKITYIDSSQGPPTPKPQPVGSLSRGAAVNMPALVSRAGWGSPEPYSSDRWPPEYREWQKIAVHDTVTKNDDPNPAAT
ncbi:MAG TPA: hypothetical protein VI877_04455, partial [Dehalococcoidia bacterium]|nr:hypothetical protein [Dehalococcoidia bacterium]